jgi:hypothetical protein
MRELELSNTPLLQHVLASTLLRLSHASLAGLSVDRAAKTAQKMDSDNSDSISLDEFRKFHRHYWQRERQVEKMFSHGDSHKDPHHAAEFAPGPRTRDFFLAQAAQRA